MSCDWSCDDHMTSYVPGQTYLFQVRNLELLKLRFGEGNLHFCDVMLKDVADSRRINTLIQKQREKDEEEEEEEEEEVEEKVEVNALILSHVFWPTFREEQLKILEFVQK